MNDLPANAGRPMLRTSASTQRAPAVDGTCRQNVEPLSDRVPIELLLTDRVQRSVPGRRHLVTGDAGLLKEV